MADNKRMAGDYEIESAFFINGKEVVFGVDDGAELPYMVGFCSINPIFGLEQYYGCMSTASYAQAMQELAVRIQTEAEKSLARAEERGIREAFTAEDCIPDSQTEQYVGRLIVIRAEILQRDKRTADYQLCRATGGNGCNPKARGQSVYAVAIYDGRKVRYDRADVLGIIKPERIPDWAKARIRQMEKQEMER